MGTPVMEKVEKAPLISVVIPLFNKAKIILKTLESLRRQTYRNYETVIVDDGSTDGSAGIVEAFMSGNSLPDQPPWRLIRQSNTGVAGTRNRGIGEARGKYVAFLDADDEWMPEYLSCMDGLIRKYAVCDVFASLYAYREPDRMYPAAVKGFPFDGTDGIIDNYFEMAVTGRPPLTASSVTVSKKALLSVGGFPDLKMGEDFVTWGGLACRYKIAYHREVLAVYNRLPESYENGSYAKDALVSPRRDEGGALLEKLRRSYPGIKGLKDYCFLWHKMRFVMLVNKGRRAEAVQEWRKNIAVGG